MIIEELLYILECLLVPLKKGDRIVFLGTDAESEILEVGYFKPNFVKKELFVMVKLVI